MILLTLAASVASRAEVADTAASIVDRIEILQSDIHRMTPEAFANPALHQWMLPISVSSIKVAYLAEKLNQAIDPRHGEGLSDWKFIADSYLKHRSSTLWGSASYINGIQRNPVWNESSDYDLIYPYVVADSIGGDLNHESYALSGGYADHTDRWAWGATLSYTAGLHFRSIDPRPRNVTGQLHLRAGAAWRIPASSYLLATSLGYMRYKQSADITFVNELADNRIWHLTGLGTHYRRFAGQGYSHSYQGNRMSASLNLFPHSGCGFSLSAKFSRFEFSHILTSLNNMPLQKAADSQWDFEAAWLSPADRHDFAITAALRIANRRGRESIFGDASAGIYPQIGELPMYRHSSATGSLRMLWLFRPTHATMLSLLPSMEVSRSHQTYADPYRLLRLSALTPSVEAALHHRFAAKWSAILRMGVDFTVTTDCRIDLPLDPHSPLGMQNAELRLYDILSRNCIRTNAAISLTRALTRRYALTLSASYSHHRYAEAVRANNIETSLAFVF